MQKILFIMRLIDCELGNKIIRKVNASQKLAVRLKEIGIEPNAKIEVLKKSKLSGCMLVGVLGSVFILDRDAASGVDCYE